MQDTRRPFYLSDPVANRKRISGEYMVFSSYQTNSLRLLLWLFKFSSQYMRPRNE